MLVVCKRPKVISITSSLQQKCLLLVSALAITTMLYATTYLQREFDRNSVATVEQEEIKCVCSGATNSTEDPSSARTLPMEIVPSTANNYENNLMALATMGNAWTTLFTLETLIPEENSPILKRMRQVHENIQRKKNNSKFRGSENNSERVLINLAAVSCGRSQPMFKTMIKTATMFSRDAALHVIIFSDQSSILDVAQDVLELKWTVNALGWDFTYELHLTWFPDGDVAWDQMYTPCATQRIFFPPLLPHIDSLIYLDTDILVLSNLTEFWLELKYEMRDEKMVGMAANNEPGATGWYSDASEVPYFGSKGVNAGVMLANLTQMRAFNFSDRALAAQVLYNGKIVLADQDLINIIFHGFPERMHQVSCTYNFNWVHCGDSSGGICESAKTYCFCNATLSDGVKLLHGNSGTFLDEQYDPFMVRIYQAFEKFDLLTDSAGQLLIELKASFNNFTSPCGPLTAEMLYMNAEIYLSNIIPDLYPA